MSDELLVFVIGLLLGGCVGTLALALVLAGSDRRHPGAAGAPWATDPGPMAPVSVTSFMRVDLLHSLRDTNPFMRPSGVDANDLDLELKLLLRRYGKPSGPSGLSGNCAASPEGRRCTRRRGRARPLREPSLKAAPALGLCVKPDHVATLDAPAVHRSSSGQVSDRPRPPCGRGPWSTSFPMRARGVGALTFLRCYLNIGRAAVKLILRLSIPLRGLVDRVVLRGARITGQV